jgi:hypothetical protein
MLSAILHRKRKAAKELASVAQTVEEHRHVYGTRLLVRGVLWVSIYLLSRGLLELQTDPAWLRIAIALLPVPFFVWYLWTWFKGAAAMDELQRRIELEALGFAFPAAVVVLMTLGLLDIAIALPEDDFSLHGAWLMMPVLYYIGLWRAKSRYQ